MYHITTTNRFEKNVEQCKKRGYNMELLRKALSLLAETGTLPATFARVFPTSYRHIERMKTRVLILNTLSDFALLV